MACRVPSVLQVKADFDELKDRLAEAQRPTGKGARRHLETKPCSGPCRNAEAIDAKRSQAEVGVPS